MDNIYFADLIFKATKTIKSLPPFYGARFSAMFRYACKSTTFTFEDICLAILPFRSGTKFIEEGETFFVRLVLNEQGAKALPLLCNALTTVDGHGEFSSNTLQLESVLDGITQKELVFESLDTIELKPFEDKYLADEVKALMLYKRFTLSFESPLRLRQPAHTKRKEDSAILQYCQADFFYHYPYPLAHLLLGIRFLDECQLSMEVLSSLPTSYMSDLDWVDMRYSQKRQVPLGGIVGRVKFEGKIIDEEVALRLVKGQYLGLGSNSRFGLGFYKIEELDPVRNIAMPNMS